MKYYLAANPTQTVDTSGLICFIVSNIAIPKNKNKESVLLFEWNDIFLAYV